MLNSSSCHGAIELCHLAMMHTSEERELGEEEQQQQFPSELEFLFLAMVKQFAVV